MNDKTLAKGIIRTLEDDGFYAECPCCEREVPLRGCGLFYLDDFSDKALERYEEYLEDLISRYEMLQSRSKQISRSSEIQAKAINIGFILERLAPSLSTFRFQCNDCRSLFDPIDYVIFEGLCTKGVVTRILFADVKTGRSRLTQKQREIRELVNRKKVSFETYEVLS